MEECKAGKAKCDSDLATQTSIAEQLNKQLTEAVALLKAEKEAREQLVATMLLVQQTSQKLQEDLKQLQVENAQLQAQVQKLQAEQSKSTCYTCYTRLWSAHSPLHMHQYFS